MSESVELPLSSLKLDPANARLAEEQPNQPATAVALAGHDQGHILAMAEHIVAHGLDPSARICVVPSGKNPKGYVVIEGNRRVLALKALETPSLVAPALISAKLRRLQKLSEKYAQAPIDPIPCELLSENEARIWVDLRHTGQNLGAGLVGWGSDEQDRFRQRHGEPRSPAGQVMDFVEGTGDPRDSSGNRGIITNISRLIKTPEVRKALGIEVKEGEVYSAYPAKQVAKGLAYVVDDFRSGRRRVSDIYHADQRAAYVSSIPKKELPQGKRLSAPALLSDLAAGAAAPRRAPASRRRRRDVTPRGSLIPRSCSLDIDPPRINNLYVELSTMPLDTYPNGASVSLRVFLELSVDHYLQAKSVMSESDRRNANLAKRLKAAAAGLREEGRIGAQLETAIRGVADGSRLIAASTTTFNQYVHNAYAFPKALDLRQQWDELQPFVEALWAK